MDFSAKLENLQAKVNETVETARAAADENRDQLKQRVDKAQDDANQAMEDAKTDIAWGHQIRSYVLDQSRIKDLRTNVEIGNTQSVLDGNLDDFIEASLKQGV